MSTWVFKYFVKQFITYNFATLIISKRTISKNTHLILPQVYVWCYNVTYTYMSHLSMRTMMKVWWSPMVVAEPHNLDKIYSNKSKKFDVPSYNNKDIRISCFCVGPFSHFYIYMIEGDMEYGLVHCFPWWEAFSFFGQTLYMVAPFTTSVDVSHGLFVAQCLCVYPYSKVVLNIY